MAMPMNPELMGMMGMQPQPTLNGNAMDAAMGGMVEEVPYELTGDRPTDYTMANPHANYDGQQTLSYTPTQELPQFWADPNRGLDKSGSGLGSGAGAGSEALMEEEAMQQALLQPARQRTEASSQYQQSSRNQAKDGRVKNDRAKKMMGEY